jgi:ABC-type transport system involved in multi-copper enzyme maturation permease subunit
MTRLIRTELLKLATMRLTYGLAAVAAALTALFCLLENNQAGASGTGVPPISTPDGLRTVTTVTGFAMLFAAVLGSIIANGEFRHSTATLTYLATPRRARVLGAKTVAALIVGSLFGVVAGTIATGVGLVFVAAHGDHVALSAGTLVAHVAGAVVGAALLAALGVAVGSLVRSQLATVIGIFVWAIIVESVIGGRVRPGARAQGRCPTIVRRCRSVDRRHRHRRGARRVPHQAPTGHHLIETGHHLIERAA